MSRAGTTDPMCRSMNHKGAIKHHLSAVGMSTFQQSHPKTQQALWLVLCRQQFVCSFNTFFETTISSSRPTRRNIWSAICDGMMLDPTWQIFFNSADRFCSVAPALQARQQNVLHEHRTNSAIIDTPFLSSSALWPVAFQNNCYAALRSCLNVREEITTQTTQASTVCPHAKVFHPPQILCARPFHFPMHLLSLLPVPFSTSAQVLEHHSPGCHQAACSLYSCSHH